MVVVDMAVDEAMAAVDMAVDEDMAAVDMALDGGEADMDDRSTCSFLNLLPVTSAQKPKTKTSL